MLASELNTTVFLVSKSKLKQYTLVNNIHFSPLWRFLCCVFFFPSKRDDILHAKEHCGFILFKCRPLQLSCFYSCGSLVEEIGSSEIIKIAVFNACMNFVMKVAKSTVALDCRSLCEHIDQRLNDDLLLTGYMLFTKFNGLLICRGRSVEHFKAYSLQHSYDITSYSVSWTGGKHLYLYLWLGIGFYAYCHIWNIDFLLQKLRRICQGQYINIGRDYLKCSHNTWIVFRNWTAEISVKTVFCCLPAQHLCF